MCDRKYYTPKKCDTPQFKTPISYHTPVNDYYSARDMSDSEESTKSNPISEIACSDGTANSGELSLVAEFDDLMRVVRQQRIDEVEDAFLEFSEQTEGLHAQWKIAIQECERLRNELDIKTHEYTDLENKLAMARKLLDQERKRARKAEEDRDHLDMQMTRARDFLFKDNRTQLPDDTREKLAFLNDLEFASINGQESAHGVPPLSAIQEVNTTGSLLSDFSYTRSEDDLDVSAIQSGKTWRKHRPSSGTAEPARKKLRSSNNKVVEIGNLDKVRATTTLTVSKDGPITATSIIESVPPPAAASQKAQMQEEFMEVRPSAPQTELIYDIWQKESSRVPIQSNIRQHSMQAKTIVMPDTCGPCEKRIRFGKTALKCKDCRAVCHPECKDNLPLPCIPHINTPTQRGLLGVIGDYTPTVPPMVPALIVHCVNEIELRGSNELGIYRIPGSERDVKALKERFLRGKGAPCLNNVDIHVLCGTVKDFLRSLHEPLITHARWRDFVRATEAEDALDIAPTLYQIISELPQPNRDTLAYMMLHLKKIAESPDCKMPVGNLSKVFGPTIVGYSSSDLDPAALLTETKQQARVVEHLMNLPVDYWDSFVNVRDTLQPSAMKLQQTPSTDSLLRPTTTRGFFTPHTRNMIKRKQRFFPTPPIYK